MGIYIKGAFGAFSGKVGNLVGSSWRSIDYMRSLPKPSKKPASDKQMAHRAKFALAVQFLSPLRELINLGYNDKSLSTMTAFNKAVDELIPNIEGVYPDYAVPYPKLQFSKGPLTNIQAVFEVNGGMLDVSWTSPQFITGAADTDRLTIVMYNAETDDFFVVQEATRGTQQYMIEADGLPDGDYHIWTLLSNEKGQCSKTRYQGTVTL